MEDEKHESKRNCHPRQKWLPAAAILLLVLLIAGFSLQYISFVSQTIYQESTSHLEEVLHKSNNMLKEMVRKNLTSRRHASKPSYAKWRPGFPMRFRRTRRWTRTATAS